MSLELYLAFALATALLILVPGPANALIVANSIAHGGRRALVTVAGVSAASVVHLSLVALGMTSLMALLSEGFEWLRWLGVAYLVYLGLRQWRAAPLGLDAGAAPAVSGRRLFWTGFIVDATNPKTLFFYAAFFPQFIDPAQAFGPQIAALCGTFLVIQTLIDGGVALLGGRLRPLLAGRARLRNRLTGGVLIGAGLGLALARKT
jgi:threonine/homoserine/homoserine lactone efflux protein